MKTKRAKTNGPGAPRTEPIEIKFGRILVPVDFSEHSRQVLRAAVKLAQEGGGRLILLHVIEPVTPYPADLSQPGLVIPPVPDNLGETAMAHLQSWKQAEVPESIVAEVVVKIGQPYYEITAAAGSMRADLIIISTHGRTGLKHILMGSTAERIVRHANCPVLVAPRTAEK